MIRRRVNWCLPTGARNRLPFTSGHGVSDRLLFSVGFFNCLLVPNEALRASGWRGDGRGFVPRVAGGVILFEKAREFVPIEPAPACPQAGEKFEFARCKNRHANLPPDQRRDAGPLHPLHAGISPAAVRPNINSRPHTLRFRSLARLQTVPPLARPEHTRCRIAAAGAGMGARGPPHRHPVSIRAPAIGRRAAFAVHFVG